MGTKGRKRKENKGSGNESWTSRDRLKTKVRARFPIDPNSKPKESDLLQPLRLAPAKADTWPRVSRKLAHALEGTASHVPWSSSVEPPQFHPWRSSRLVRVRLCPSPRLAETPPRKKALSVLHEVHRRLSEDSSLTNLTNKERSIVDLDGNKFLGIEKGLTTSPMLILLDPNKSFEIREDLTFEAQPAKVVDQRLKKFRVKDGKATLEAKLYQPLAHYINNKIKRSVVVEKKKVMMT
ncbi:hypothetical protein CR513_16089, partial [Mucuna pruriens]